jgi:hypothetical protein
MNIMITAFEQYKKELKQHLINHSIELAVSNGFSPEQNANIYLDEHKVIIEMQFESLRFLTDLEYLSNKNK